MAIEDAILYAVGEVINLVAQGIVWLLGVRKEKAKKIAGWSIVTIFVMLLWLFTFK